MSSSWYDSNGNSESFIVDDSKPLRQFHPNQFYKVCPKTNGANSNAPICGDGSPFCFYVSKPSQRAANNERLLIELMGGGACWDADTCKKQADYLYVNSDLLDITLGRSCQEVQYGLQEKEVNILCSGSLGETDFSTYNTVIIPYCTQDVHVGSNTVTYTDNNNNANDDDVYNNNYNGNYLKVHHTGANNVQSVLEWIYKNFPNLRHVTVTGCSAGGTAVPVVQQLLHQHYNHFGNRNTQLAAIADSPVFLTPSYFLQNGLSNWNPQQLLNKIGVPYNKYKDSEDYPTQLWDFILRKGDNRNRWGFVSHTYDPVSLIYYQYMSGNGGDNNNRRLDDNNNIDNQWYTELTNSISFIENKHHNVKSFWVDGEGHCTLGMYYALQDSNFEAFASNIVKEDPLIGTARPAFNAFLLASCLGLGLIGFLIFNKRRRTLREGREVDDDLFGDQNDDSGFTTRVSWKSHWKKRTTTLLTTYEDHPVVTGYALCICLYFWFMIIEEGFCHPVNNPSFGPNAVGLSNFGINNPSLIVYQHQWFRLLTSNFLVTGALTFFYANFYLWFRVRHLERRMLNEFNSPWLFVTLAVVLATVINAFYCLFPSQQGASATAIPLLMGLHACHLTIYWNSFVRPFLSIAAILLDFVLILIFFPFNSWVMMLTALVAGPILARISRRFDSWLPGPMDVEKNMKNASTFDQSELRSNGGDQGAVDDDEEVSYETMDERVASTPDGTRSRRRKFITRTIFCAGLALFVLLIVPFFINVVASPNKVYSQPFYTGCKLFYTTDIDGLSSSSFVSNDDENEEEKGGAGRRIMAVSSDFVRWLQGDDQDRGNYQCASFCIPHMVTPVFKQVVHAKGIPIQKGTCRDQGYSTKLLDKTFSAFAYSLDVELYSASYNNNDEEH
ncbi:pectin acetylesterase [Nitzschia inconspicua]|uniref:Pectin acetylesterase n=1 Tax=Nitzschia inconspicua TaxID=303405 RepID=A0A9K3PJQ0_9STRA|nr:pectin acetylesterase [Nitzschia inconspicua]